MSHLQCLLCSRLMRSAAQQLRAPCVHARQHVRRAQGGCQALRYASSGSAALREARRVPRCCAQGCQALAEGACRSATWRSGAGRHRSLQDAPQRSAGRAHAPPCSRPI